ncbi:PAS domain-containing protein [Rhodococcus globerulus]|uniref:PAS domain-containing protein n=1 Tax=Rhodococcus globerulus TaxID=33008 RepID=UPI0021665A30|nr:PAS domain-containing protein [Rhodococcus globerulus]
MHGYEPGTIAPTTELPLSHRHPDDRPHVAQTLETIRTSGGSFSSRHRIVDTRGTTRSVVVAGDRLGRRVRRDHRQFRLLHRCHRNYRRHGQGIGGRAGRRNSVLPRSHRPGQAHADARQRDSGGPGIRHPHLAFAGNKRESS